MRLTRQSAGHYTYGCYDIVRDIPQPDMSVGTGNGRAMWNIYKHDDDDEPVERLWRLSDVRAWLEKRNKDG